MFRVDPSCQRTSVLEPLFGNVGVEDHTVLEVTHRGPTWVLHALSAKDEYGHSRWRRFFLSDLREALRESTEGTWIEQTLYVLLLTSSSRANTLISTRVLQVWECRASRRRGTFLRVTTMDGIELLDIKRPMPSAVEPLKLVWHWQQLGAARRLKVPR